MIYLIPSRDTYGLIAYVRLYDPKRSRCWVVFAVKIHRLLFEQRCSDSSRWLFAKNKTLKEMWRSEQCSFCG